MKNVILLLLFPLILFSSLIYAQNEPFTKTVLNEKPTAGGYRLAHPFDIVYGPDNFLYITEKIGRIVRVDTGTGARQIILDIQNLVTLNITRSGSGAATNIGQNGMLGLALHPQFANGHDTVFVAYSYNASNIRIVKYKFNPGPSPSLTNPVTVIQGIPAGGDHSTGRLIVGADNKLYYSCGDLGHNQFGNRCLEIRSQMLPSQAEINSANYALYSGKILRINFDGSIPADNPVWNGVRSHIYTIGHRNPQGLVWEKNPSNGYTFPTLMVGGKLFSSEHGPNTDDEVNSIESGRNYGWPYIAGDTDEVNFQYINWSTATNCNQAFVESPFYIPAGATVIQEKNAPAEVKANFRKPLVKAYTDCSPLPSSVCEIANGGWLKFPTIAPSSIEFYHLNSGRGIPNWYPSLLVPTLRTGTLFRYRLNAARDMIIGDSIQYFKSVNRYRDIALSPDGKIYIITDSIGSTSGPSGSNQTNLANKGAILVFQYTGTILPIDEKPREAPKYVTSVFPNPATSFIQVETEPAVQRPIRYRLVDITGKLVLDDQSSRNNFSIPVERFKRGIYILKLYNALGAEVRMDKIVLQ